MLTRPVPQITMETLCRLRPLLPGLSLEVLRARPPGGAGASCRCWSRLGAGLRPAQRAMVFTALQEVLDPPGSSDLSDPVVL